MSIDVMFSRNSDPNRENAIAQGVCEKGRRLRVLLSAYACEPGKGSEPGVGWNLAKALSDRHDVWVLTRENNRHMIEGELAERPVTNLRFIYYDLPRWSRWWKRGSYGVRIYYYLWQLGAIAIARRAHSTLTFDLAHHLTFVKYWAPAAVALAGIPVIWGPVGGGESMPRAFLRSLSMRSRLYEYTRSFARWLGERDPFVKATSRRADIAIATTPETANRLRGMCRCPVVEMSEVALTSMEVAKLHRATTGSVQESVELLSVGRLLGWKGYHLALHAFRRAAIPGARYMIFGDGPERRNLQKLASRLGIQEQVTFGGVIPRTKVLERLLRADVFVHPSLHDSGGWATLEAMAASLPVICLGIGGPAVQVLPEIGRVVIPSDVDETIEGLAKAMRELAGNERLRTTLGVAARHRVQADFSWARKVEQLSRVYGMVAAGVAQR